MKKDELAESSVLSLIYDLTLTKTEKQAAGGGRVTKLASSVL